MEPPYPTAPVTYRSPGAPQLSACPPVCCSLARGGAPSRSRPRSGPRVGPREDPIRPPRDALKTALIAACASALVCFIGGSGGWMVQLRDVRRRLSAVEDDYDALDRRIARRDGQAGREVARQTKSREAAEIERI